ncbi:molybdopterin-dependent oxidoreductase [Geobacter sp. DSM 9736]|uniref:molybdopterin-dependent oxidoreductase n=1 Tax=Geobacter sp. DSM 9736 TaxID=1277350 RepID=UPI000B50CE43|nr:molybdopterin-dependent oxidoreductase [Geobacter sp. DSM 9736]SNB46939.1 NADH dehydrogenase subunit G [Geobacter sp. DSM 9736]
MPKLIIDNIPVEVPPGTNVLEAARAVGIVIPHFCYHEALGSVGACRLCAMKFVEGPVKGVQMSCMIPAQDGMVVSTTDGEAARLRQLVIEWLMINHPHDCPVCDEGGECLLQDYTVAGGHGIRRFQGKKRTFLNQYLGPYIHHEMNRCIECYRCSRFYQEYAGGTDLGAMGSAGRVYFGRFTEGELESPFSGNLLDICPTGVYTDRTARYRARYWDYQMAPSICPWCSLGCNTLPAARYRELLKTAARRNDAVNGWFICDRGRFTKDPVNDPARPRTPLIDGNEAQWEEALDTLASRLQDFIRVNGAGSLAVVGSSRLSLEGALLLQRLSAALGAGFLCFFSDDGEARRAAAAVEHLHRDNAASLAEVRTADMIVLDNCDPLREAPVLLLAVRQAWRKGARIFSVGATPAGELARTVSIEITDARELDAVPLAEAERGVIITGRPHPDLRRAGLKLFFILEDPNSFGAALLAREHRGVDLSQALDTGRVKGVIAIEADLPKVPTEVAILAAADWLATEDVARAGVFLPTAAWVEMDGTWINNEGRAQRFQRSFSPGRPVKQEPTVHPPHTPRHLPPGSDPKPAWEVAAALLQRLSGERVTEPLSGRWEVLRGLDPNTEGFRMLDPLPGSEKGAT